MTLLEILTRKLGINTLEAAARKRNEARDMTLVAIEEVRRKAIELGRIKHLN